MNIACCGNYSLCTYFVYFKLNMTIKCSLYSIKLYHTHGLQPKVNREPCPRFFWRCAAHFLQVKFLLFQRVYIQKKINVLNINWWPAFNFKICPHKCNPSLSNFRTKSVYYSNSFFYKSAEILSIHNSKITFCIIM